MTIEESNMTTQDTSRSYRHREEKISHLGKYHRHASSSLRNIKSQNQPVTTTEQQDRRRRPEHVVDAATNVSPIESEMVAYNLTSYREKNNTLVWESSRESHNNVYADYNDVRLEEEYLDQHRGSFTSVSKHQMTPVELHNRMDRESRITYSKHSAADVCHQQYLAGMQEHVAYFPFPSSSDRLDCATQFVSRESCKYINLCPSASRKYITVDTANTSPQSPLVFTPSKKETKKRKNSRQKSENRKQQQKSGPIPTPPVGRRRGAAVTAQLRRGSPVIRQPKYSQNKYDGSLSRGKDRMFNNSSARFPNSNTNYAGVSLKECGKELNLLIQDTLRDYGDWKCSRRYRDKLVGSIKQEISKHALEIPSNLSGPIGKQMSLRCQFDTKCNKKPGNANSNKLLGRDSLFQYSPKMPLIRKPNHQNHQKGQLVLANLLHELEALTKKINRHYNSEFISRERRSTIAGTRFDNKTFPSSHRDRTRCGERSPSSDRCATASLDTLKTGNECSRTINNKFNGCQFVKKKISKLMNNRSPFARTKISKRKKVLVKTCPVPLHETEFVSYVQLLPKCSPVGGFKFSKIAAVPSKPKTLPSYLNTKNMESFDCQTLDYGPNTTCIKDELQENFTKIKPPEFERELMTVNDNSLPSAQKIPEYTIGMLDLRKTDILASGSPDGVVSSQNLQIGNNGDDIIIFRQQDQKPATCVAETICSSPPKLQEVCSKGKKRIATKGSYVANFHKALTRMKKSVAKSSTSRQNSSANKPWTDSSPGKGCKMFLSSPNKTARSQGVFSHTCYKTNSLVQNKSSVNSPRMNPRPEIKQTPFRFQNKINKRQEIFNTPDSPQKVTNMCSPYQYERPSRTKNMSRASIFSREYNSLPKYAKIQLCNTRKISDAGYESSAKKASKLVEKLGTAKNIRLSSAESLNVNSTLSKEYPPHGPTESVRYEIKFDRFHKINRARRRQNPRDVFKKRYYIMGEEAKQKRISDCKLRWSMRNKNRHFLTEQNEKTLESDSKIGKNVTPLRWLDDKTKTLSPKSAFNLEGNPYYLKESLSNSMTPSKKKICRRKGTKLEPDFHDYLNSKVHKTSCKMPVSFVSRRHRRVLKNNLQNMPRRGHPKQHISKHTDTWWFSNGNTAMTMNCRNRDKISPQTQANHKKHCEFDEAFPCDAQTTASKMEAIKTRVAANENRVVIFDNGNGYAPSTYNDTFSCPRKSRSSSEVTQSQRNRSRLQQKYEVPQRIRSFLHGSHQLYDVVKCKDPPVGLKRKCQQEPKPNAAQKRIVMKEKEYGIAMKDKGLGVAKFIGYCISTTSGSADVESSSSTSFVLDTLDEISESLSDDDCKNF